MKIGLIGGMSYLSTIPYYRIINEVTNTILGEFHSADCVLISLDFNIISNGMHQNRWDIVAKELISAAKKLELLDCDIIAIACNSVHHVFDAVQKSINTRMIHILEPVIHKLKTLGHNQVGLLGTKFTMSSTAYLDYFKRHNINVHLPDAMNFEKINEIIFKEICQKKLSKSSLEYILKIVDAMKMAGVKSVVLGCTELTEIIHANNFDLFFLATTKLHAQFLATEACKKNNDSEVIYEGKALNG